MPTPTVAIVMRSYNDVAVIRDTLGIIKQQACINFELWSFDSSSSDGTCDVIAEYISPEHIRSNDPKQYIPGNILNAAMSATHAEIVVFINSDATPERTDWLKKLIAPFDDPNVGAVYGRQTSRPDCRSLFIKDNERAFGDGSESARWIHFFSMANSAIRRSIWEKFPFENRIQYSEDIEWSYRVKNAGFKIAYVADAPAMHSHNYTLKQTYKRHFGEGRADAWIFRSGEVNHSLLRYVILPFGMEVLRDMIWGVRHASLDAFLHSIPLRFLQKWGRWRGYKSGMQSYAKS